MAVPPPSVSAPKSAETLARLAKAAQAVDLTLCLNTEALNLDPGMYVVSLEFKGQDLYLVRTGKLIIGWQ